MFDLESTIFQMAPEQIGHHDSAQKAQRGLRVGRGPAGVHRNLAGNQGLKQALSPAECIVQLKLRFWQAWIDIYLSNAFYYFMWINIPFTFFDNI